MYCIQTYLGILIVIPLKPLLNTNEIIGYIYKRIYANNLIKKLMFFHICISSNLYDVYSWCVEVKCIYAV